MSCGPFHAVCQRCKATREDMHGHFEDAHNERWGHDVNPCIEEGCDRSFPTIQGLRLHTTRVHRERTPPMAAPSNGNGKLSPEEARVLLEVLADHPVVKLYERAKAGLA